MLNKVVFQCLAGDPEEWDAEIERRCSGDDHESLVDVQVEQHGCGRREATLWENVYGWCVGYASNLDNRAVIKGGKREPGLTKAEALAFGVKWANEDPTYRSFFVFKDDIADMPEYASA